MARAVGRPGHAAVKRVEALRDRLGTAIGLVGRGRARDGTRGGGGADGVVGDDRLSVAAAAEVGCVPCCCFAPVVELRGAARLGEQDEENFKVAVGDKLL